MNIKRAFASLCVLFIIFSCNQDQKDIRALKDRTANFQEPSPAAKTAEKQAAQKIPVNEKQTTTDSSSARAIPAETIDWDKKIIKTAALKLEVKNFKGFNEAVHQTVRQFGGYIAQEEQTGSNEVQENTISIKVPVAQFESMLNQLSSGDVKVSERKITTEDVTSEYVDTRSRLEAKKEMRLKYLEFLKQSKNMTEVLQVQNEVNGIQEEIEAASGRVTYLSHQSAYSTINLTFFQPNAGFTPKDESPTFLSRVGSAFKTGGHFMGELFVGLVSIWPLMLIVAISYFGYKKYKAANPVK